MKIVVDISEEEYAWIKELLKKDDLCPVHPYKLIANGTPIPDNATNGDVEKALFPDCDETGVQYELTKNCNGWLDEPYQKRGCFRPTDDNSGTFCI